MRVLTISLKDNQQGAPYYNGLPLNFACKPEDFKGVIVPSPGKADLKAVSRIIDKYLIDDNGNSRTLADLIKESDDSILGIACSSDSRKEPYVAVSHIRRSNGDISECYLETGNLMGSLRFIDPNPPKKGKEVVALQLDITSRFDNGRSQRFVNYIMSRLQRVDFIGSVYADSTQRGFELLLMVAFIGRLGAARGSGVFRQYRVVHGNDINLKGRIDLAEHLRKNYPMEDRIAYVKTIISTDVPINHLIRYAVQKIMRERPMLLESNADAYAMAHTIAKCTPTWNPSALQATLSHKDCLSPVRHPFFAEYYEEIRRLARMIVQDDDVGLYGENLDSEVSGVVFDGAMLWEGYLDSILGELGYLHSDPETGYGALDVFEPSPRLAYPRHIYPDFYRKNGGGRILDAKYKRGLKREDILQMLAYVLNTGAKSVGLVYPPSSDNDFMFTEADRDLGNYCCAGSVPIRQGFDMREKVLWRSMHFEPIPVFSDAANADKDFVDFMKRQEDRLRIFAKGKVGEDGGD